MILSDRDIKTALRSGKIVVEGLKEENIQAAWVDLSLGNEFGVFKTTSQPYIDVKNPTEHTEKIQVKDDSQFIIHPHEFVLGQVKERIRLPDDIAAYVDGRSSLGRIGLVVHVTSGFVDPGFSGRLVLEMTNVGNMPVAIHPGMRVCKLVFFRLSSPSEMPYYKRENAKYKDQNGITSTKIHKDFEK
jgi:dCTP deaminase